MLPGDRRVGELWCSEVLELLSEYLDGELPSDSAALVDAHVSGCDNCARFGVQFGAMVTALRQELQDAPPLDAEVRLRLQARLAGG